jgi:hypothetical protein
VTESRSRRIRNAKVEGSIPFRSTIHPRLPASSRVPARPVMRARFLVWGSNRALARLTPSPGIHAGLSAGAQVERNFGGTAYGPLGSGTPNMVIIGSVDDVGNYGRLTGSGHEQPVREPIQVSGKRSLAPR